MPSFMQEPSRRRPCVLGLHEADDGVVYHLGSATGHRAAAVHCDRNWAAAAPTDLGEVGEPFQEGVLSPDGTIFCPVKKRKEYCRSIGGMRSGRT